MTSETKGPSLSLKNKESGLRYDSTAMHFSGHRFFNSAFCWIPVSQKILDGNISIWADPSLGCFPGNRRSHDSSAPYIHRTMDHLYSCYVEPCGIIKNKGIKCTIKQNWDKKNWTHYIPYIVAFGIIAYQIIIYIFGMHLDEDDARWIAEANDALVKNRMYLHNPATGEYIGRFVGEMQKDVFSPWGMYIAVLSRLTTIRAAVIAHTIYPPILLGLSYIIYDLTGKQLFKGTTERGIFLLMVSMINMFMAGNPYTQAVFTLTRIWQGKAVVAAIMIPLFLFLLLQVQKEDAVGNWLWFAAAGCASCLFSGMGIAISTIMIAVYGLYAVVCKRFKRLPLLLLSLLPSLLFGFFYFQMKG